MARGRYVAAALAAFVVATAPGLRANASVAEARRLFEQHQQADKRARELGRELVETQQAAAQAQRQGDAAAYRQAAQGLQRVSQDLDKQAALARHALRESAGLYADAGGLQSDDPALLLEYAEVLRAKGDLDLVEQALTRAAERRPDDAALWLDLGRVRVETGPAVGGPAAPALRRALDLTAEAALRAEAYAILGRAFLEAGLAAQAERAYRASLEAEPGGRRARQGLARVLIRQGRMADALALVRTLEREAGAGDEARRAFEALRSGVASALGAFGSSGRILPDEADQHAAYGDLLARAGRLEDARRALLRALELDPELKAASATLQQLERMM
jgi:tetratricopeptide (TPR) repeat protein